MEQEEKEQKKEPTEEEEKTLALLKRLNKMSDFCEWREKIAKPLITQWQEKLNQAENMSEVELRATIKHYNTLKTLFYDWFDIED